MITIEPFFDFFGGVHIDPRVLRFSTPSFFGDGLPDFPFPLFFFLGSLSFLFHTFQLARGGRRCFFSVFFFTSKRTLYFLSFRQASDRAWQKIRCLGHGGTPFFIQSNQLATPSLCLSCFSFPPIGDDCGATASKWCLIFKFLTTIPFPVTSLLGGFHTSSRGFMVVIRRPLPLLFPL